MDNGSRSVPLPPAHAAGAGPEREDRGQPLLRRGARTLPFRVEPVLISGAAGVADAEGEETGGQSHRLREGSVSCKLLALELFRERALVVSRETIRRVLHRLEFRWRRPRPLPPEKGSPEYKVQSEKGSKASFLW